MIVVAEVVARQAAVRQRDGFSRLEPQRLVVVGDRLLEGAEAVVHHAAIVVGGPEPRGFVDRAVQVGQRVVVAAQVQLRQATVIVGDRHVRIEAQGFREQLDRGLVVAGIELDAAATVCHTCRHAGHVAREQGQRKRGDEGSDVPAHPFTTQLKAHIPASTATVAKARRGCAYADPTNSTTYTPMNNVSR